MTNNIDLFPFMTNLDNLAEPAEVMAAIERMDDGLPMDSLMTRIMHESAAWQIASHVGLSTPQLLAVYRAHRALEG